MYNKNTVIAYEGPSLIDGKPITVLASGFEEGSSNSKTGAMIQTQILVADQLPTEAAKTGADISVCGSCPLRPTRQGGCYVTLMHAPNGVWRARSRGRYRTVTLAELTELCAGQPVRLGSYGDPAAVPIEVWDAMVAKAKMWTGYSHQWKAKRFDGLKRLCMASVGSAAEKDLAQSRGWATFRVRAKGDTSLDADELSCPASIEAGHRTTCEQCGMCNGANGRRHFISIQAHGTKAKRIV